MDLALPHDAPGLDRGSLRDAPLDGRDAVHDVATVHRRGAPRARGPGMNADRSVMIGQTEDVPLHFLDSVQGTPKEMAPSRPFGLPRQPSSYVADVRATLSKVAAWI